MHTVVNLARAPHSHRPTPLLVASAALLLLLLATVLLHTRNPPLPPLTATPAAHDAAVQSRPHVAHKNGSEVIWQLPAASPPRAAVFIAPGCTIRATDFFDPDPSACPRCAGLPEERLFVLGALRRGYAVLAVSSWAECWTLREEVAAVESIIRWWVAERRLEGLPIVGIGASSGGYFLSALATRVEFCSIVVMIAEGVIAQMEIPDRYPPTLFVHMPKDQERMEGVRVSMEALKAKGVDVQEVRCDEFAVTAGFLSERIPGLGQGFAKGLVDALCQKGFVDEKGYLRRDGRKTPWKELAEEGKLLPEGFRWDRHVTEELNLAFALHEFTSLKNGEIFDWFELHMNHKG